jgi:hypothetical protein
MIMDWLHWLEDDKILWNNNNSKFNHTIDIVIVTFDCMLYNMHSDPSVIK